MTIYTKILPWLYFVFCTFAAALTAGGQDPKLLVQTGHIEYVNTVAFSPDGKLLASGGDDKTVKIWNAKTGQELNTFAADEGNIHAIIFSPDGTRVIGAGSLNGAIQIWNLRNGKEIATLRGHAGIVDSIAISSDGKFLVSGSSDGTVKLWNLSTNKEIKTFEGHGKKVDSVAFSRDGKMIASGGADKTVRVWDAVDLTEIATFRGHSKTVTSVEFSPDGRLIASKNAGWENDPTRFWDISEKREIEGPVKAPADSRFSPDWKFLAVPGEEDEIKIIEVSSGKVAANLNTYPLSAVFMVFSPDNKQIACLASNSSSFGIWDIETGRGVTDFVGATNSIYSATFSPDGRSMFTDGGLMGFKLLWKIGTDIGRKEIEQDSVAFSRDGKTIAAGGTGDELIILNAATYREINRFKTDFVSGEMLFSPDDKILAYASGYEIILFDIKTGKKTKTLSGHTGLVNSIDFSSDGNTIASCSDDKTIRLWNASTGSAIWRSPIQPDKVASVAISRDGKMLVSGGEDKSVKLWDITTRRELKPLGFHEKAVTGVVFSKDGKMLASGSEDRTIKLWNMETRKEIRTLTGHSDAVSSVVFIPQSNKIASVGWDGAVKFWDIPTGKELASLIAIGWEDWVVVTPEGLFDGTPNGWEQILWQFNNDTLDYGRVEMYLNELFYPNLLGDILAGKSPVANRDFSMIDRRQPKVEIVSIDCNCKSGDDPALNERTIGVIVEVSDNAEQKKDAGHQKTSGAQDLRLFRNGSLVSIWHGDLFGSAGACKPVETGPNDPRRTRCRADIPTIAGENTFTAYAFNSNNIKSEDAVVTIENKKASKKKGILYILAIGLDDYADPALKLSFSVSGVEEISSLIRQRQDEITLDGELRQYAETRIITLKNETATKENISRALRSFSRDRAGQPLPADICANLPATRCSELKRELSRIRPTEPEDALMIYFNGHGTSVGQNFYMIPYEYMGTGDENSLKTNALSDVDLNRLLEPIDSGRFLMIIDACRSGQLLGRERDGSKPLNSKGLAQLAYDKGMLILTASQNHQSAYQVDEINGKEIKRSLLTYALSQGLLRWDADKNEDDRLWAREWFEFAADQVPLLFNDAVSGTNKALRVLRPGVRSKLIFLGPPGEQVQTPRIFYRRETEANPLVVAKRPAAP